MTSTVVKWKASLAPAARANRARTGLRTCVKNVNSVTFVTFSPYSEVCMCIQKE